MPLNTSLVFSSLLFTIRTTRVHGPGFYIPKLTIFKTLEEVLEDTR